MLTYYKCPTCSMLFNNSDKMIEEISNVDDNQRLSMNEKATKKGEILKKYGIYRYCCIPRVLCEVRYEKFIVT